MRANRRIFEIFGLVTGLRVLRISASETWWQRSASQHYSFDSLEQALFRNIRLLPMLV
jgi:hypothetical protein